MMHTPQIWFECEQFVTAKYLMGKSHSKHVEEEEVVEEVEEVVEEASETSWGSCGVVLEEDGLELEAECLPPPR
jgi:hypothetical protein